MMANLEQLQLLKANVADWNEWRKANPNIGIDLGSANLYNANLIGANLSGADLHSADLTYANLYRADLSRAILREAAFSFADLGAADLSGADLTSVSLFHANMAQARINDATLSRSYIHGVNAWNLVGEFKEQKELIITRPSEAVITVDNIEVAQFVYLLLNNQKIRNVIDTVTTKTVLILGRFTPERKQVLDALKDALRERGFIPMLFDFKPSPQRDLTETVQLLANMAKFIIADITEAKSIPQELSHIIPFLPSVPVQPILLASDREYGMFDHWRSFSSVLPEFLYQNEQDLINNLETKVILPIDTWHKGQNEVNALKKRVQELEARLAQNERS